MRKPTRKIVVLLVSLVLTGVIMRLLSPPAKLDVRFLYSVAEAHEFFASLTPHQWEKYFWGEVADLWFLANYSWLFLLWARFLQWGKLSHLTLATGIMDLGETLLILLYLYGHSVWVEGLTWFSTIKWCCAFLTLATLGVFSFRRKSTFA
jgi:hypothetical protein